MKNNSFYYQLIFFLIFQFLFSNNSKAHADTDELDLSGEWLYAVDIADEGVLKKWYLGNLPDTYLGNILLNLEENKDYGFIPSFMDKTQLPNTTDLMKIGMPDQSPWINYLQRKYKYMGAIWFQKIVEIPADFEGYDVELYLERVKWQSRVWIDGRESLSSPQDGLVTSHKHNLAKLTPGKHLISIRVDNRLIHPIGDKGHNYTEQTESIWNGIIGEIKLRRVPNVFMENIQIFSNLTDKTNSLKVDITNPSNEKMDVDFSIVLKNQEGKIINNYSFKKELIDYKSTIEYRFKPAEFKLWDSENPNIYSLELAMYANGQEQKSGFITFGNRVISTSNYKILVNGNAEFIRGNQEALGYPPTGHPPVDVETWRKIFKKYKEYGLNQVRFHSSTPPQAAFQAADELGIYIMAELAWMTSINAKNDLRPISATMGIPQGLGNDDRTIDEFIYAEYKRLFEEFGNHPSFVFFSFGNEMDNINRERVNGWIAELKEKDNRRLYAATTARAVLEADDFQDSHIVPGFGQVVNRDDYVPRNNYDSAYVHTKLPVIAHELGQFPSHPLWSDIDKYDDTPFRFINLEKAKQEAEKNGVAMQDSAFQYASGKFQMMLYKSEIERQFRSKYSAGYNLLQMNDYTGQGEALVGWLDAFYDEKNYAKVNEIRNYNRELVLLAEFDKRVYNLDDLFSFTFKINSSLLNKKTEGITWQLVDEKGDVKKQGRLKAKRLKLAEATYIGESNIKFDESWKPGKYTLKAQSLDKSYENSWEIWIYRDEAPVINDIIITSNLEKAIEQLKVGKNVLLFVDKSVKYGGEDYASFKPVFWSTLFFPGRGSKTLGALIENEHPIFNNFPTDNYLNWNWMDICKKGSAFILKDDLVKITPLVQPINDFHTSLKLASVVEVKVGRGNLIISGYNLTDDLVNRPAAKSLFNSIVNYMNSDQFNPKFEITEEELIDNFEFSEEHIIETKNLKIANKNIVMPNYFDFAQLDNNTVEFKSDRVVIGKLKFRIHNEKKAKSEINLQIEDRKQAIELDGSEYQWIELQFFREDFDDQKFVVSFEENLLSKISHFEVIVQ